MGIPNYPSFKNLDIQDKSTFQSISSKLAPFVECSFFEMYAWNTRRKPTLVSMLNENIVLRTDDFLNDEYTTTFIGRHLVTETIKTLITNFGSVSNIHEPILRKIRTQLKKNGYTTQVETDKVDYLINSAIFVAQRGKNFENFRRLMRKFDTCYPDSAVQVLSLLSENETVEIIKLFKSWGELNPNIRGFQLRSGVDCLNTLQKYHKIFDELDVFLLKFNGKLIGFSINERTKRKVVIGHFLISDKRYKGSFEKLTWEVVNYYAQREYKILNIGYDLGINSLRATKTKLFSKLYKKYKITKQVT